MPASATSLSTPRITLGRLAAGLADEQRGVIAHRQLLALGWSRSRVKRATADGRLVPVWPGVYAHGHRVLTRDGWLAAGALACGEGALLTGRASAAARELMPAISTIDVVTPGRCGLKLPGIRAHRTRLRDEDRDVHRGLPVTSLARTALDMAALGPADRVAQLLDEALLAGQYDHREMLELMTGCRGARGMATLRAAVEGLGDDGIVFRSRPERLARDLLLGAGIAAPRVNAWFPTRAGHGHELDLWWPWLLLNIEIDGPRHRLPHRRRLDALRDADLRGFGVLVIRIETHIVERAPELALARMLEAVHEAERRLGSAART